MVEHLSPFGLSNPPSNFKPSWEGAACVACVNFLDRRPTEKSQVVTILSDFPACLCISLAPNFTKVSLKNASIWVVNASGHVAISYHVEFLSGPAEP